MKSMDALKREVTGLRGKAESPTMRPADLAAAKGIISKLKADVPKAEAVSTPATVAARRVSKPR